MYSENTFYSLLVTILSVAVGCVLLFNMLDSPPVSLTLTPDQAARIDRTNREAWERAIATRNS
jgi:hypothetical protein